MLDAFARATFRALLACVREAKPRKDEILQMAWCWPLSIALALAFTYTLGISAPLWEPWIGVAKARAEELKADVTLYATLCMRDTPAVCVQEIVTDNVLSGLTWGDCNGIGGLGWSCQWGQRLAERKA